MAEAVEHSTATSWLCVLSSATRMRAFGLCRLFAFGADRRDGALAGPAAWGLMTASGQSSKREARHRLNQVFIDIPPA